MAASAEWRLLAPSARQKASEMVPGYLEANPEPAWRKRVQNYLAEGVFMAKPRPKPRSRKSAMEEAFDGITEENTRP